MGFTYRPSRPWVVARLREFSEQSLANSVPLAISFVDFVRTRVCWFCFVRCFRNRDGFGGRGVVCFCWFCCGQRWVKKSSSFFFWNTSEDTRQKERWFHGESPIFCGISVEKKHFATGVLIRRIDWSFESFKFRSLWIWLHTGNPMWSW